MDIILVTPILAGILAGWLVNYLADVLPITRSFSRPTCRNCNNAHDWNEYLYLSRCQNCGQKRIPRTYIVLFVMLAATIYVWFTFSSLLNFFIGYILLIYLGVVLVIDLEYRIIMHPVSYVGAVIGLGIGIYTHGLRITLIGGAFGFGAMLILYYFGEAFSRYMSKRRGQLIDEVALGFGDVNLSGITGLLLGWDDIILGLLFAIFAGGIGSLLVIVVMLIRKRYKAFTPIPYAPFLIFSILLFLYR